MTRSKNKRSSPKSNSSMPSPSRRNVFSPSGQRLFSDKTPWSPGIRRINWRFKKTSNRQNRVREGYSCRGSSRERYSYWGGSIRRRTSRRSGSRRFRTRPIWYTSIRSGTLCRPFQSWRRIRGSLL